MVSAVALIMSLYIQGVLPSSLAIIALFLVPVALALGGFGGLVIRLGIPIMSILTLSIILGGGNIQSITGILSALSVLVIVLLAFYVMFLPFRRR